MGCQVSVEGEAGNSTCDWNNPYSILKEFNLPYMYIDPCDSLDTLKNVLFKVMTSKLDYRQSLFFLLSLSSHVKDIVNAGMWKPQTQEENVGTAGSDYLKNGITVLQFVHYFIFR